LRYHRTTGLTSEQLQDLVELVGQRVTWSKDRGRPKATDLTKAVVIAVAYLRQNIPQEVLGEYFEVSQPTVSRIIQDITPVVADVLDQFIPNATEATEGRVILVDGTLAPCWSWAGHRELYSGKHKTTGHVLQILSNLGGDITYISRPQPGSMHDAEAFRQTGLAEILDLDNTIGDKGYGGLGIDTPTKKPIGGELAESQKEENRVINSLRAAVERAVAHVKNWRVLHTDYRRPLQTFADTLDAVVGLIFFKKAYWAFE
jgi:DDE superfamily endonuclease/Helix-turn-helix of DDE superfamily endonuclease